MLTVCPKCTLTLAVTAADLRVGQGYVRCGRCATVFNALLALSDASTLDLAGTQANQVMTLPEESANDAAAAPPASTAASTAAAPLPAPASMPAVAGSAEPDPVITVDPELAAAPLDMLLEQTAAFVAPTFATAPTGKPEVPALTLPPTPAPATTRGPAVDEDNDPVLTATGTVQTIVLEGNSISHSEEFVDIDTIDSEIALATRRALEAEARRSIASLDQEIRAEESAPAPDNDGKRIVETRLTDTGSVYVYDSSSLYAPRKPPPKPPPSLLLWSTFALLLTLILGVQAVHHWRNDLALRNDWIGQSLTRLYAVLAVPLTPNWDLRGYDVRQLGAATNGSGDNAIRVRISLANHAKRAQPYPVLRLSLYNRYGKRVAARDLQPRDYLPKDKAAGLMPMSQQIDSEVAVLDPGPDASSFELDVCIPAQSGLRCASDTPLRTAHT